MPNEFQTSIYSSLGYETKLVVGLFINQVLKSLILIVYACHIQIYGLKYFIVGNATLNNVISFIRITAFATTTYKIKPFLVIRIKFFNIQPSIGRILKNVQKCINTYFKESFCVLISLLL